MKILFAIAMMLAAGCVEAKRPMAVDPQAVRSDSGCPHADAMCAMLAGETIIGRGACTDPHEQPPARYSFVACTGANGVTLLVDPDTCRFVPVWCDFDGDGCICGAADWAGRQALPGGCPSTLGLGEDLDCDGDVDLRDFAILQVWGMP